MANLFSNENAFIFVPSPVTTAQLRAIVEGMESDTDLHPVNEDFPVNVAVRRVFDVTAAGEVGYMITFGALDDNTQPIRVEVVTGADDPAKIEVARTKIGRGGEFIGFADFGAAGATESVIIFRRAATPPEAAANVDKFTGIFTAAGNDWLKKLDALNPAPTTITDLPLKGLAPNGLRVLAGKGIFLVTDADIDTDGPGGSKSKDPSWQKGTSLERSGGGGCDSRTFPGVVLPPAIRARFGAKIGDFAVVFFNDRMAACQVYDSGPEDKIGEISVGLAWALGIPPVPAPGATAAERAQVESLAARKGNNVPNLLTVVFPNSGGRPAATQQVIGEKCAALLKALTSAAETPVFAPMV